MEYVCLWFGAWAILFCMIMLWKTARRFSEPRESVQSPRQIQKALAAREREAQEARRRSEEAQRRRVNARASCEVFYEQHRFELRERFPREMFDAFVTRHLGDDRSPDFVERQAAELQKIIRQHLSKIEAKAVPATASVDAEERRAARAAVQDCYDQHAAFLAEAFPPLRLMAELKVRIPETATAEAAWKQARKMIHELLTIIAEEKAARKGQEKPRLQVNPPIQHL